MKDSGFTAPADEPAKPKFPTSDDLKVEIIKLTETVASRNGEIERLNGIIKTLREEVGCKDRVLHEKNLALDALGHVWCSGGCDGGVFRYGKLPPDDIKLTERQVSMIERNTIRLRDWFEARQCRISQKSGQRMDKCTGCPAEVECVKIRLKATPPEGFGR